MKTRLFLLSSAAFILSGCSAAASPPIIEAPEPQSAATATVESLDIEWDSGDKFSASATAPPTAEKESQENSELSIENDSNIENSGESTSPSASLSPPPSDATYLNVDDGTDWSNLAWQIPNAESNFVVVNVSGSFTTGQLIINPGGKTVQIRGNNSSFQSNGESGYWLDFSSNTGGRLEVADVNVSGYANGVRISGGYIYKGVSEATGEGPRTSGVVINSTFSSIGDAYNGGAGYAAVHIQNSSDVAISGNTFSNNVNYSKPGNIHSVYLVYSNGVSITNNSFNTVSGDPIRLRNDCQNIIVANNSFSGAGSYGYISDWYCNSACQAKNGQGVEYRSPTPSIYGNSYNGGYYGWIPEWAVTV